MPRRFIVEADGGSRGNPGPAGYGALVKDADSGELLVEIGKHLGIATNNVAEYGGLVAGLAAAATLDPAATVEVRMDSKLVVEQMSGRWSIKHEDMRRLAAEARQAMPPAQVRYTWVPRAQNSHADRLANEAMDGKRDGATFLGSAVGGSPSGSLLPEDIPASPGRSAAGLGAEPEVGPSSAAADTGRPTTLVLIRHGRTIDTGREFTGPGLGPALDEEGARQARLLAGALTRPTGIPPIDVVVGSPLLRARQTAETVCHALGLVPTLDRDWIEAASLEQEAVDELVERVGPARDRLLASHPGGCIALVTHAGPIKALVMSALEAGPAGLWRLRVDPASVTVLRFWDDGECEVGGVNDVSHLR